jgi:hypothetical protein
LQDLTSKKEGLKVDNDALQKAMDVDPKVIDLALAALSLQRLMASIAAERSEERRQQSEDE